MRALVITLFVMLSHQVYAGCEATILEGSHTALTKEEAKAGAWEDASDVCYPGDATPMGKECETVSGEKGINNQPAIRCVQQASCTVCGDDLTRKYEALD